MHKKLVQFLIFTYLILCTTTPCSAETITLKNGKVFNGTVIERTKTRITIDTGDKEVKIPIKLLNNRSKAKVNNLDLNSIQTNKDKSRKKNALADLDYSFREPQEILDETIETYRALKSYSSNVDISTTHKIDGEPAKATGSGKMMLGKPYFYRIELDETLAAASYMARKKTAIWNAGNDPYIYHDNIDAYTNLPDDQFALNIATTLASINKIDITNLFFIFMNEHSPYIRLKNQISNLKLLDSEYFDRQPCWVIKGQFHNMSFQIWISQTDNLILKLTTKGNTPTEVTDESKQVEPDIIISGPEVERIYTKIKTNFDHTPKNFEFEMPPSSEKKSSYQELMAESAKKF